MKRLPDWKIRVRNFFIFLDNISHHLPKWAVRFFPFCGVADIAYGWSQMDYGFPTESKVLMFFYKVMN